MSHGGHHLVHHPLVLVHPLDHLEAYQVLEGSPPAGPASPNNGSGAPSAGPIARSPPISAGPIAVWSHPYHLEELGPIVPAISPGGVRLSHYLATISVVGSHCWVGSPAISAGGPIGPIITWRTWSIAAISVQNPIGPSHIT